MEVLELGRTSRPAWSPAKTSRLGKSAARNHFNSWKPAGLGNPGGTEEELALAVLSALSVAGLHSAINPSVFTLLSFGTKPEAKQRAMTGLWIGLGASTLASVAIYFVFKKPLPALIAEATAVLLFGVGVWAVRQEPADTIPSIEQQEPARTLPQEIPGP